MNQTKDTSEEKLLLKFKQHLLLEKALSANTAEAYVRDVAKLLAHLARLDQPIHPLDKSSERSNHIKSSFQIEDAFHGIAILSLSIVMEYLSMYSG